MLRGIIFIFWGVFSTIVYGLFHIFISFFSKSQAAKVEKAWNRMLLTVGGVKVEVEGLEQLDPSKSYVIYSNHSSLLDIPILVATFSNKLCFMAKKELFDIPIFGASIRAAGNIPVDRSSARQARKSIADAAHNLQTQNISVLIYPEGTRSETGEISEFKSASFALALEAKVDVVPVYLHGANKILPKKAWFVNPGIVKICVGKPIKMSNADFGKKELAEIVRKSILDMRLSCLK